MSRDLRCDPFTTAGADRESIPKVFRLSTYQYLLPSELIAQEPAVTRDESRLLVIRRQTGRMACHHFRDLPSLLKPSDVLVFNETKVTPATLTCRKPTGGVVELLVLNPAFPETSGSDRVAVRTCLVRAAKRLRPGSPLCIEGLPDLMVDCVVAPGRARIRFPVPEEQFLHFLDRHGVPPLPPYIRSEARDRDRDISRYQTVYAKTPGAVAAPTAGLHFTPALLECLEAEGIALVRIVLHVGPGTFIPVREEDTRRHRMETESYEISTQASERLLEAQREKRRIIAVGTTSARALESAADETGRVRQGGGKTDLFITPGYHFRVVQGMVTNFHLPGSTLLMMVSAFGGTELLLSAYERAISERFRFYSYGDVCLIID
jgi:S-adenosylmethionine:tRNA ribosyltransferase-isomerase